MEWFNISSVVAWSLGAVVTIVLSVFGNLLTDPVRNRLAALSERRARRRVAAIVDRLARIGMWRREPWRVQAHLFGQLFYVITMLGFALFLLLNITLNAQAQPFEGWRDLALYVVANLFLYMAFYASLRAQNDARDMQFFVGHAAKMVGAIEKLRCRYPALGVTYPDYSEVQEAVAQFRAKDTP